MTARNRNFAKIYLSRASDQPEPSPGSGLRQVRYCWTNPPSAGGTYNLSRQWSDRLQNWRERSPSSVLRNVVWDLRYLTCPQRYRDRDITEFGANSGPELLRFLLYWRMLPDWDFHRFCPILRENRWFSGLRRTCGDYRASESSETIVRQRFWALTTIPARYGPFRSGYQLRICQNSAI